MSADHGVRATVLDAVAARLETRVVLDLTAGVAASTTQDAVAEMRAAGAALVGTPHVG